MAFLKWNWTGRALRLLGGLTRMLAWTPQWSPCEPLATWQGFLSHPFPGIGVPASERGASSALRAAAASALLHPPSCKEHPLPCLSGQAAAVGFFGLPLPLLSFLLLLLLKCFIDLFGVCFIAYLLRAPCRASGKTSSRKPLWLVVEALGEWEHPSLLDYLTSSLLL